LQVRNLAAVRQFAAVPAAQDVDWNALEDAIPSEEGKRELFGLKKQFQDIASSLDASASAEPIDWGYWKKELGDEALVSSFETAFNNIKIPEYDGKEMEAAKAIFAKLEQEATQESADAEVALKELRAELEMVQSQMAELDTMTVEDVFKKDPAMAKEIDDEIRAGDWFDSSRA